MRASIEPRVLVATELLPPLSLSNATAASQPIM
jgi:hypothetical protein